MIGYGLNWPQHPSPTAMKYLRYDSSIGSSPKFGPGDLYRCHRDMEAKVPEYKEIRRELRAVTEELDWQKKYRSSLDRELSPPCSLRNTTLGYTSERIKGNNWKHSFAPSTRTFSVAIERNPYMRSTFRYLGLHRRLES